MPIGRPLPGIAFRIVDAGGREVPPGGTGELVVEGPCTTPGYWRLSGHRNEENHRRGAHATGDLVTLEGEELVFRGRIDDMVKIRGFRVEPAEIEGVLASHPAIDRVAVIPVETGGETRLVACYSLVPGGEDPSLLAIKTHCADRLPPYMIPHLARRMDSLPTNPNGKIDRRALALALRAEASAGSAERAPGQALPRAGDQDPAARST